MNCTNDALIERYSHVGGNKTDNDGVNWLSGIEPEHKLSLAKIYEGITTILMYDCKYRDLCSSGSSFDIIVFPIARRVFMKTLIEFDTKLFLSLMYDLYHSIWLPKLEPIKDNIDAFDEEAIKCVKIAEKIIINFIETNQLNQH